LAELVAGAERYREYLATPKAPPAMNPGNWLRLERWRDQPFALLRASRRWREPTAREAISAACADVCVAMGGQDFRWLDGGARPGAGADAGSARQPASASGVAAWPAVAGAERANTWSSLPAIMHGLLPPASWQLQRAPASQGAQK
jgi:hypothetical protein